MPAETTHHERTLMAWPTEERCETLWHEHLEAARDVHARLARLIAAHEPVTMVAAPSDAVDAARRCGDGVEVVALPIDDSWMRDTGPLVVRTPEGQRRAVHFRFNAWGEKYTPYDSDARVGAAIAEHLGLPVDEVPLVLEGGAIAVDGHGLLVTTERTLLNPNRNPRVPAPDIERVLECALGVERVIWLPDGIAEDDETDGHVDNVVAFFGRARALLQGCDDPSNPNQAIATENRVRLEAAGVEVVEIPLLPYAAIDGRPVPVPYANLYAANGLVVVPVTGHAADADVLALIGAQYPDREVATIPGELLAYGGGGVHCVTQQVPA
jgi:agmatine deiminase